MRPKCPKSQNQKIEKPLVYYDCSVLYHVCRPLLDIWGCLRVFGATIACFRAQSHVFSPSKQPPAQPTWVQKCPQMPKIDFFQSILTGWTCIMEIAPRTVFGGVWGCLRVSMRVLGCKITLFCPRNWPCEAPMRPKCPKSQNQKIEKSLAYYDCLVIHHVCWPLLGIWGRLRAFGLQLRVLGLKIMFFHPQQSLWDPYEAPMRPKCSKSQNQKIDKSLVYCDCLVMHHVCWPLLAIWGCLRAFGATIACFRTQNHVFFTLNTARWGPYEAKMPKISKSENQQIAHVLWLLGHASCLLTLTRYLGVFDSVWGYNCVF